jgi:chromate transporter
MAEMEGEARQEQTGAVTRASLWELAILFLRLGTTAFGGPAAHVAMMEGEVVRHHRWLTREKFLDLLGAANIILGPNSTELAIHVGYLQAGWPGLVVAGSCFILPAALIVTAFAWAYVRYGSLPQTAHVLYGVKPVIIAVVLQELWGLSKTAVKMKFQAALGVVAVALSFLGVHELLILFCAGAVVGVGRWIARERKTSFSPSLIVFFIQAP